MRLALAILLCAATVARADTVTGMVQSVGFATTPAQRIIYEPLNTPANIGGVFTHTASNAVFSGTNGWFSNRLAGPMSYRVKVGPHPKDWMTNFVIGDGGTYDWLSLATNATIANTQTIALVIRSQGVGVSNQFTRPRIFSYPGGTNAGGDSNKVWTLTNTVTGEGEWRASGSGEVTTAQLNTASNVLWSLNATASNFFWGNDSYFTNRDSAQVTALAFFTNRDPAFVTALNFLTNWSGSLSNLTQTKQHGTATLTNISSTGAITNLNNNQFEDESTIASIKSGAPLTNISLYPSNITSPALVAFSVPGIETNSFEARSSNGTVALGVTHSNTVYIIGPEDSGYGAALVVDQESGTQLNTVFAIAGTPYARFRVSTDGSFNMSGTGSGQVNFNNDSGSGNIAFGNSAARWWFFQSSSGDLVPNANNTRSIGNASTNVRSIFVHSNLVQSALGVGTNGPFARAHIRQNGTNAIARFDSGVTANALVIGTGSVSIASALIPGTGTTVQRDETTGQLFVTNVVAGSSGQATNAPPYVAAINSGLGSTNILIDMLALGPTNHVRATLTANAGLMFSNVIDGMLVTLELIQDSTGNRTLVTNATWGFNMRFGIDITGIALDTNANTKAVMRFVGSGTNALCVGNLRGFAL